MREPIGMATGEQAPKAPTIKQTELFWTWWCVAQTEVAGTQTAPTPGQYFWPLQALYESDDSNE